MEPRELLDDAFGRIQAVAHRAVDGLDVPALVWHPDPGANPIAWLVWHLARIQDDHLAELAGTEQVWEDGWAARFGLPATTMQTGFGHGPDEVAAVRPESADALLAYLDAVTARTRGFLADVDAAALDEVVDTSWDPAVTMGVRLVSVIGDGLQHAGQAAYVRGLHERIAGSAG